MQGGGRRCCSRRRIRELGECFPTTSSAGKPIRRTSCRGNHRRRFWAACRTGPETQSVWRPCCRARLRPARTASVSVWAAGGVGLWTASNAGWAKPIWGARANHECLRPDRHIGSEAESVWGTGTGAAGATCWSSIWTIGIWPAGSAGGKTKSLRSSDRRRKRLFDCLTTGACK